MRPRLRSSVALLHHSRNSKNRPSLNIPNPALVSQRAVERLPRLALLLLTAAYVLPGVFRRDPWKNADIAAFGAMINIAHRGADWLAPTVGGVAADIAPLPYLLGALAIQVLSPWVDPAVAARMPFSLLLVATLSFTWYASFHLARSEAARPLPFAFGGEASVVDYSRAIADGAVLALIATLGLLQLGHETTPELVQLAAVALFLYGLAASANRRWRARCAIVAALPVLAASGAPVIAVALGAVAIAALLVARDGGGRVALPWVAGSLVLAALLATWLGTWRFRYSPVIDIVSVSRALVWFTWPAWPLALWTLWRWRAQLRQRHIAVPLGTALVGLLAFLLTGGWDRALMLALPAMAVLASFALPTMKRSLSAAIDWFSVFFFSIAGIAIWVIYAAVQTGVPAKPAANVMRLAPGFEARFSPLDFALAAAGTLAWIGLVKWRTGRHRYALWKSMVLPASGVSLCWLLLMTLWLPLLDYGRSYRPLIERVAVHVRQPDCIGGLALTRAQLAALEYFGGYWVDGHADPSTTTCEYLVRHEATRSPRPAPPGWTLVARERRPTDRDETLAIFRRAPG
jgi:hypothetical protein